MDRRMPTLRIQKKYNNKNNNNKNKIKSELSSLSDSKQQQNNDNDKNNNNDNSTKDSGSNSMSAKPDQDTALDLAYAANQIQQQNCCTNKIHKIYREKYNLLIKAMTESQQFCYVTFGEDGGLVQAEVDIQINSENRL